MAMQFFKRTIEVRQRRLHDVNGLILSSRLVLPLVDANFRQKYLSAFGSPFFSDPFSPRFCCILADAQHGYALAWADNAPECLCDAYVDGGKLPSGADQRSRMHAALSALFGSTSAATTPAPPASPVAPAAPSLPTGLPPPGTPRPLTVMTRGDDGFLRFTFAAPDPRVNSTTGAVRPGTYCTPYRDGQKIASGFEAVARFALPVPLPYKHLLLLVPGAGISIDIGAVGPAFGQSGGGVEALFTAGFTNPSLQYHSIPTY